MNRRRGALRSAAPWLAVATAVATAVALGLPLVGRGFASEDFLLLRTLAEKPPWGDPGGWLLGPWLGIDVVRFYRPVSQLLLAVEAQLFGANAWLYGLVHLAVHAANVGLVYRLAGQLAAPQGGDRSAGARAPLTAALLFALFPLHPNAVAWVASYATLFAACFSLAALSLWLDWQCSGGGRRWAAAFVLFLAALGSYEAAVVVPLLLAGSELLPAAGGRRRAAARVLALAPFFAVLVAYLLFRRSIFGAAVGGYASFANRLAPAEWPALAGDAAACLFRLLHPVYTGPLDGATPAWAPLVVLAWVVVPALLLLRAAPPDSSATGALRRWGYAWAWALVSFLPFAFQPFVPANGRYAYLAAAGLAVGFGGFVAFVAGAAGRRRAAVAAMALTVGMAVQWATLLPGDVAAHRRAGAEARQVSERLAEVAAGRRGPLFVADHPLFVRDASGTPLAQVLRYGLSDSLRPPFGGLGDEPAVYPLPEVGAAPVGVLRWEGERGRFVEQEAAALPSFTATVEEGVAHWHPVAGADGYRLVVATAGNPVFVGAAAGETRAEVPADFVRSMRVLYAAPVWWWVEARQGGRVVALSNAAALRAP